MNVIYRLVRDCPEGFVVWEFSQEKGRDFRGAMKANGYHFAKDQEQLAGSIKLRECLVGQPRFSDLCGPMYDGEKNGLPVVRYESQRVADMLSV